MMKNINIYDINQDIDSIFTYYDVTDFCIFSLSHYIEDDHIVFNEKHCILNTNIIINNVKRPVQVYINVPTFLHKNEIICFKIRSVIGYSEICEYPEIDCGIIKIKKESKPFIIKLAEIVNNEHKDYSNMTNHVIKNVKVNLNQQQVIAVGDVTIKIKKNKVILYKNNETIMTFDEFKEFFSMQFIGKKLSELSKSLKLILNDTNLISKITFELDSSLNSYFD